MLYSIVLCDIKCFLYNMIMHAERIAFPLHCIVVFALIKIIVEQVKIGSIIALLHNMRIRRKSPKGHAYVYTTFLKHCAG